MKKLSLLVPAFAVVLLGAGCASSSSGSPAASSDSSASSASASVQLPADFPKEIPVYERGTVENATSDSLDMSSSDSMEDVYDWYAGKLTIDGWKATSENKGKSIAAVWEKGSMSMPISVYSAGGTTYVSVSLTQY